MTAAQFIGKTLINTSAVTLIASAKSIFHGLRPGDIQGNVLPCINFYKVSGDTFTLDGEVYSINCRARTIEVAMALSKIVKQALCGINNVGTYGSDIGFDASRISLVSDHGVIPETETCVFNAPVDIRIV